MRQLVAEQKLAFGVKVLHERQGCRALQVVAQVAANLVRPSLADTTTAFAEMREQKPRFAKPRLHVHEEVIGLGDGMQHGVDLLPRQEQVLPATDRSRLIVRRLGLNRDAGQ